MGKGVRGEGAAVQLVLEQVYESVRLPTQTMLADNVQASVVDDRLCVHSRDPHQPERFYCFEKDGTIAWSLDAIGKGPGEIRGVYGFAEGPDGMLYLANQHGTRVDVFSRSGKFVRSRTAAELGLSRIQIAGFLTSGEMIAWMPKYGEYGLRVTIVDTDSWSVQDAFDVIQSDASIGFPIGISPPISTVGEMVVVGNVLTYEYAWFDKTGERVNAVARADVRFTQPEVSESEMGISVHTPSRMSELYPILGNQVLGGGEWPTYPGQYTTKTVNLDFFDADAKLTWSLNGESYGAVATRTPSKDTLR